MLKNRIELLEDELESDDEINCFIKNMDEIFYIENKVIINKFINKNENGNENENKNKNSIFVKSNIKSIETDDSSKINHIIELKKKSINNIENQIIILSDELDFIDEDFEYIEDSDATSNSNKSYDNNTDE